MENKIKNALLLLAIENVKKNQRLSKYLHFATEENLFHHGILSVYNADDLDKFVSDLSDKLKTHE